MSETDLELLELLERYRRDGAEDAFAELVRRHLNLVHSAALRQVRSPQLAEEVAQSAFADLARQCHRLAPDTVLAAWLYQVTRRTAIDVVRRESRRQLREQVASELHAMNATDADWTHIEPLLDDAMAALDATDRTAVLLRYFENKSLREVGHALGTSDDAAQKRVNRAVDRLREFFMKRGVAVATGGLVAVVSANAVQAAPAGLAATISTSAVFAGTAVTASATATAVKTIAMTTLPKAVVVIALTVALGTGIYGARQSASLRGRIQTLEQAQGPLTEQIAALTQERDSANRQLAALRDEKRGLSRSDVEVLRLKGEVTRLHNDSAGVDGIRWRPQWSDVGLSTPEDALQTYLSAVVSANADRVRQSMALDLGTNTVAVSDVFARRIVRQESGQWQDVTLGGVRIHRVYPGGTADQDHAQFEVETMGPSLVSGTTDPANPSLNRWTAAGPASALPIDPSNPPVWDPMHHAFNLVNVGGEWRVIGDESRLRLTPDDEDAEAVAAMMMQMSPDQVEEMKQKAHIPAKTLQLYEAMKAKGGK